MRWTKPFYGVSHLLDTPRRIHISMVEITQQFYEAYLLDHNLKGKGWTSQRSIKGDPETVRAAAESWVSEYRSPIWSQQ